MSANERLWEVIDRLLAGWRAVQSQVPKVLEDPRGYPRESMLLAALVALLFMVVLFAAFAIQDGIRAAIVRRRLGVHPNRSRRLRIAQVALAVLVCAIAIAALLPMVPVGSKECSLCHATQRATITWSKDAHRTIGCLACHSKGGVLGALEAQSAGVVRVISDSRERRAANLAPTSQCRACHEALADELIEKDGLRVRHAEIFDSGMECRWCHRGAGHGAKVGDGSGSAAVARSIMSRCIVCHDGVEAPAGCPVCHIQAPLDRVTDAAPSGQTLVDTGCDTSCHPKAMQKDCLDCHGLEMPHPSTFIRKHAGMSNRDPGLCTKCHPSAARALVCACHGETNEHGSYSEWFPRHGSAAVAVNNGAGCRCHDESFCGKCHDERILASGGVQ